MTAAPIAARTGRRPENRWLTAGVDAAALTVMIVVAGMALGPAYGGARWLVALGAGTIVGILAGLTPALLRWPAIATVAIGIVGYVLVGPAAATPSAAVAGFLPGVESTRLLALGIVSGWKQMLTVADPVGTAGGLLVPAMLIGLVVAAASSCAAARLRHPLWALLGPGVVLAAAAALGTARPNMPIVTGVVVGAVALAWGAWRTGGFGPSGIDVRRPYSLAVLVVVAIGAGVFVTPALAPGGDRATLRDVVQVRFDPQDYPSPLSAFRRYVKAEADTDLLTVTGLPADGRIRLATMDTYDGLMYDVSDDAGAFTGVGDRVRSDAVGDPATIHVTIDDYTGVWLPDIGAMTHLAFGGPRAGDLAQNVRYSQATGTAVVPIGLQTGDEYELTAIVPPEPDEATMAELGPGPARLGATSRVPAALTAAAASWTENQDTAYAKVEAIRSALSSRGLLDHGQTLGSPSGHGYDRLLRLMNDKDMVGDQEQFAPTMALMVQSLGIPARVVMGWKPGHDGASGPITLTGADVTAWVEVDFESVGWIPFDPTPDESRVQQQAAPQPEAAQRQQVLQPPPPPRVPQDADATEVDDADSDEQDHDDEDSEETTAATGVPWLLIGSVGIPLLVILIPIAVIAALKLLRRRRWRRGSAIERVAGGWERLLDGAVDLGATLPGRATRTEAATALDRRFASGTTALATVADRGTFGPEGATDADAEQYWEQVRQALAGMGRSVSIGQRLRAKVSTLSLRRRRDG